MVSGDLDMGFSQASNKAKEICDSAIREASILWSAWVPGSPEPRISYEIFDYTTHLAETLINSFYNSASKGFMTFIPGSILGGYPAIPTGSFISILPTICTWSLNSCQHHINNIKDLIESMGRDASNKVSLLEANQLQKFATGLSNEIHTMLTSGSISCDIVTGTFTTPLSVSPISISVSGRLSGSNMSLTSSFMSAFSVKNTSNSLLSQLMGTAFISYCASLTGTVYGSGEASACVGSSLGFIVS